MMKELALINSRLDGRYDIQSLLGRGSYAEIYVARDTVASPQSPHHLVVIKALNVFLQNDLDTDLERTLVENFQNEAIALDRVRHPNIISRLGHGTARDLRGTVFHYLVLEYLEGGDLARLCRQKSLSFEKALKYLEQVCAGLAHAHKNGVIHRDIKPQNLLLTADRETVKIADFGVARVSQTDSPITRVGTDIYAPPEHSPAMAGTTGVLTFSKLTPAADIYSLAKTAYVLFTCESPRFFAGHPITELPFTVRQEPWALDLLKILQRATQNNPEQRYETVDEFWQNLARLRLISQSENSENKTHISARQYTSPRAHVSKGYSPLAPERPRFNTSRDLKLKQNQTAFANPSVVIRLDEAHLNHSPKPQPLAVEEEKPLPSLEENQFLPPKKKYWRNFAIFLIFIGIFAGSLFATYNYLRDGSFFPQFRYTFNQPLGTANGDVFLRPAPNTTNDPIGVVTKDSRLRIVGENDNWYQVEIIEHGRPKLRPEYAEKGWVSGKYVDISE